MTRAGERFGLAALAAGGALAGCVSAPSSSPHTPFSLNESAQQFNARIQARFPIGSPEGPLVSELTREHFKIKPMAPGAGNPKGFTSRASFEGGYYVAVTTEWWVLWRAEAGRIAALHAYREATGL